MGMSGRYLAWALAEGERLRAEEARPKRLGTWQATLDVSELEALVNEGERLLEEKEREPGAAGPPRPLSGTPTAGPEHGRRGAMTRPSWPVPT